MRRSISCPIGPVRTMKDAYAPGAIALSFSPGRHSSVIIVLLLFSNGILVFTGADTENRLRNADSREFQNTADGEEFYEPFYEWSVWSPCSRTCGVGVKFRGQLCLRKNKALCQKKSRIYQTCNTQPCPKESENFRDVQCASYNGRDIFINGERAKWKSYSRGGNQCLLFCYPDGEELFYYFGKARDGTQCSKEPYGVCVRGRCKSVGCDYKLDSGVYMDKCRVCGGNSTTCQPMRGRIQRSPTLFERISGYADLMVIPKGATSVLITDNTWNYLALKKQNGNYVINGNRIVNWSGIFKVGDVEVQYDRISNNIRETIEITGPTKEDITVMCLLMAGKVNMSFEYWRAGGVYAVGETPQVGKENRLTLQMGWGSWTTCSASCGGGIKVRSRYRAIEAVASFRDKETDVQRCNTEPCHMMKAAWSEWGDWDDCSATCGGGARIRFRNCKKPSASSRSGCPGKPYAVEQCNAEECPKKETRPGTSKVLKHSSSSMVTTSSNLHSRESSEGRKKLTESLRRPHASRLSSASQYHERHKTYTEKLSQDILQTVFSRGKQGHSISYTMNTLPTSRSRLLFSSENRTSTGYIIGFPTRSLKETSTLSSKFVRLQVTSFYHKHTSSVSLAKEKPELLTSPIRKGTHTKIFLHSSSTPLLDVGGGLSVFSTGTSVPASYEIVRPSVGFMTTSKASNLRTTSIGLKVSLHSGVTPRPREVNNPTISFGYERISSQVDRNSVLASFSKETIEQPVSIYSRQELVSSSKLSRAERTSSHQYPVDVMGLKSRERKHHLVTLSSASEFRTEPSILLTTPLKRVPSSSRETLNSSMIDIRRIELRLEGYSDITLQSRKKTILLTKNFSASHDSLPFEITETLRPGSSSTMNVLPSRPTSSKVMHATSVLELSANTTLSQILKIRSESKSVSSTLHLLFPPWQTLTDYLFLHGSSKPIPQTSKLMSSQITDSRKMDASYNMSKLHFLPLRSSPVSIATSSQTFARTSLLKPQFQSTFSIEKNMDYKSAFSISGIYESPIVTRKNSDDFASSTSSSLFSLSYMKLSQPLKRNPMTDSPSEKDSLSKTKIAVISERLARTSPTNPSGLFSSAKESKSLSLSQEDYPFFKVTDFLSFGQETKSQAAITSKQHFSESSTQATMPLVASSFNTLILPSASSAARIISSPLSDISGSSLSSKEIKSSISLGLTSITETEAMAMSYSKSSLLLRQILFSVMSSELTLSSPSTLSSQYRGVTSAMPGEVGEHMQSSFYPKSSSTKKVKETVNLARWYQFHTLSSHFSSQANIKATFIHLESLGSHFPEQLFPSPTSIDFTSTKNMEENIGTLNYLKYPLQKRDTLTSKHVSLTSMPERSLTEVLVHSLKTPLLQSVLISRHLQLSSSLRKEHVASKKFFATPAVYPSSRQFFLGRYDKGRISNTGSLTFSPSSQHIPSSIPHLNSPEHVGVTTNFLYSSRTSSSHNEALPLISPQASPSSMSKFKDNSISKDERSAIPTFSYAEIFSSLKDQELSPERLPTKKVDSSIKLRGYLESSSKQPFLSLKSSYRSGLPQSLTLLSKQDNLAPQTKSQMSFLIASPSVVSLGSGSAASNYAAARRLEQDSVSRPLLLSKSPSLSPTQRSRTKTPKSQTLMVHSFSDSSSIKFAASSLSPDVIAVWDKAAVESSVKDRTGDTLTKIPTLRPYSFLIEAQGSSIVKNFKTSELEQEILLSTVQFKLVSKTEIAPEVKEPPRISFSIRPMPSIISAHSSLHPGAGITRLCNDSFKTMYEMPSFPPSKTTSEINVESTSSLLQHLSLKFSPDPTSSADAQSIAGQLHSSSMQHITLSNIPPSSSPVQLDTVKSVVGSLKMAPSWETDESPVAARFNSTHISITIFSENLPRFSSSKQVLASASRPLSSSLKHVVRASVNKAHSIKSSPAGQRTIPLSQQLSSAVKEQDITNRVYSIASLSWKAKLMAENSVSPKPYSTGDETLSLPSSPVLPNSTVKSTLSTRESFDIFSSKHGVSTSYVQGSSNPISEITRCMEDSTKPIPVRHAKPLSLASMISSSPDMQSTRSLLVSSTTLSSRNHTVMISSRLTSEKPITSLQKLKTLSIRRENVILVSSSLSGTQFHSKKPKDSLRGFSPSRHEAFPPSQQRRSSLKEDGMKSPMDNSIKMLSHEVMLLSLSYGQEWLESSNLPVSSTSDKQTQSFSSTHSFPSTSSSAEKILQSTTATTHTTNPEGTPTLCPRCGLSERLHEKYCSSDFAILVRVRTGAVTNRSESSHLTKIRRIFKTNKPVKKRPELRFTIGDCNCRPDLLLKRDYFVFGNHVPWNRTISILEVNQDSFVAEWKETLEEEIKQLEGRCSRHSTIPTPRISSTVAQVTSSSLHHKRKSVSEALLSTHSTQIETPTSLVATEESCGPCGNLFRRTRAYCTSDFVVHLRILTEAIDEYSHDTKYRVQLIHIFKLTRGVTTIGTVWILNNSCRCPLLLPGKQYLLMGSLSFSAAKTEPKAEINRQSYVEEWRGSMIRRLPQLHKRCSPFTTEMVKFLTKTSARITTTAEEITTQPPVTLPSTDLPSAKCRACQISRKRNKYYCDSDFVVRAKVLKESYDEVRKERRYRVRIIAVFKSKRKLENRDDIFVFNDYCNCPKLRMKEQYVIMGKEERNTGLEDLGSYSQLVIPPRPFVWKWRPRMTAGLRSIKDICGN